MWAIQDGREGGFFVVDVEDKRIITSMLPESERCYWLGMLAIANSSFRRVDKINQAQPELPGV